MMQSVIHNVQTTSVNLLIAKLTASNYNNSLSSWQHTKNDPVLWLN